MAKVSLEAWKLESAKWLEPLEDLLYRQESILEIFRSSTDLDVNHDDLRNIASRTLDNSRRAPWLTDANYSKQEFLDDVVGLIKSENAVFEVLNSSEKVTKTKLKAVSEELRDLNIKFFEKLKLTTQDHLPYLSTLNEIKKAVSRNHGSKILGESLLIVAVADFETFISRMVTLVLTRNKSIYSKQDVKLSWSELGEFKSIDEAERDLIRKKADEITHQGMSDWLQWFAKHTGTVVPQKIRKGVIDVYQIRNSLVHKSSHKVKLPKEFNFEYIEIFLDLLGMTAALISICSVQAVLKSDHKSRSAFETKVTNLSLELLQSERNALVAFMGPDFISKFRDNESQAALQVNYWIARKKLGLTKGLQNEISDWNISELPGIYELARSALLENREKSVNKFLNLLEEGLLEAMNWNSWPLFDWVRLDGELLPSSGSSN